MIEFKKAKYYISDILSFICCLINIKPFYIKTSWAALQEWQHVAKKTDITENKGKIILFAIRNKTWMEWSIYAAFKFYIMGYKPIILYSSLDAKRLSDNSFNFKKLFNFWDSALKINLFEFIDIDSIDNNLAENKNNPYIDIAEDLAHTFAAYNLRVEEYEEDVFVEEYRNEYNKAKNILLNYCPYVEKILENYKNTRIICPNGLIEKSIILYAISLKKDINVVFIEGWARRLGHMIWGLNKPVMFYDIKGWAELIKPWDEIKEKDFKELMNFQDLKDINDKEWFDGFIPVQREKVDGNVSNDFKEFLNKPGKVFLLGTNVIGDSATLRRSGVFKNQKEWLKNIIKFFKDHPELKLIIRIHPDEISPKAKTKIGDIYKNTLKDIDNIYMFSSDNNINTNTLIPFADYGLAWVSNIGVDMILRNKLVIVAGTSNYKQLNIGIYPNSVEDYFDKIIELCNKNLTPDPQMIENAKIYQRLVFKDMSLEATSKSYAAHDYRLSQIIPKEQTKFYKILCGELDIYGREKK